MIDVLSVHSDAHRWWRHLTCGTASFKGRLRKVWNLGLASYRRTMSTGSRSIMPLSSERINRVMARRNLF